MALLGKKIVENYFTMKYYALSTVISISSNIYVICKTTQVGMELFHLQPFNSPVHLHITEDFANYSNFNLQTS